MSEQKPVDMQSLLTQIKERYDNMDNSAIYYPLRRLKINRISVETVDLMKACLIAHEFGVDITIPFISYLMPKAEGASLTNRLHRLGDNKLVLLKRDGKGCGRGNMCRWMLGDAFKNAYYGEHK